MFMCRRINGGDSMMNKLLTKASLYRNVGRLRTFFSIKTLNVDSVKRLGLGVAYGIQTKIHSQYTYTPHPTPYLVSLDSQRLEFGNYSSRRQ